MTNPILKLTTLAVMISMYFMLIVGVTVVNTLNKVFEKWGNGSEVTIYLKESASQKDVEKVKNILQAQTSDYNMAFISASDALKELSEDMGDLAKDLGKDKNLLALLPSYFVLTAKHKDDETARKPAFDKIESVLKQETAIEEISQGKEWMARYEKLSESVNKFANLGFALFCLTLLCVVGNVIRTSIYGKREEIEILELVGATKAMIHRPFIFSGILASSISMTIAISLVYGGVLALKKCLPEWLSMWNIVSSVQYLSVAQGAILILSAAVIGFVGSWICLLELNAGRMQSLSRGAR